MVGNAHHNDNAIDTSFESFTSDNAFGGFAARRYRRAVARLARNSKPTMRTLLYPLDLSAEGNSFLGDRFPSLRHAYSTIEGTDSGSLTFFLATALTQGFRLFGSGKDASIYRQAELFRDDAFAAAAVASGIKAVNFLPSLLIGRLMALPRAGNGKDIGWREAAVANAFAKFAEGKVIEKLPPDDAEVYRLVAKALVKAVPGWKEAGANLPGAFEAIDDALRKDHRVLPSLSEIASRYRPVAPDNSTLAWIGVAQEYPATPDGMLACVAARAPAGTTGSQLVKWLQAEICTSNAIGLSWLFGRGLMYWQQSPMEVIAADYGVPDADHGRVRAVQAAAQAISPVRQAGVLDIASYAETRSSLSGKLSSWIANGGNRFEELRARLQNPTAWNLPDAWDSGPLAERLVRSGTGMTCRELRDEIAATQADIEGARAALGVLTGETAGSVDAASRELAAWSERVSGLAGKLDMLSNRAAIALGKSADAHERAFVDAAAFELPEWCAPLPKVVALSGGSEDPVQGLRASSDRFGQLFRERSSLCDRVDQYCGSRKLPLSLDDRMMDREARYAQSVHRKVPATYDADTQGKRSVFHRLLTAAQNTSEATKRRISASLHNGAANNADVNRFLFENKGAFFRSRFDRSRHTVYDVNVAKLRALDCGALLDDWILGAELALRAIQNSETTTARDRRQALEDVLLLRTTRLRLWLASLPEIEYPSELVDRSSLLEDMLDERLKTALARPNLSASNLRRVVSLYDGALGGLQHTLLRDRFVSQLRFTASGDTGLIYRSKPTPWAPPPQSAHSSKPIGRATTILGMAPQPPERAIEALRDAAADADAKVASLQRAPDADQRVKELAALRDAADAAAKVVGAYMRQAPHDWCCVPIVAGLGLVVTGVAASKGTLGTLRKTRAVRLIGPSTHKTPLDGALDGLTTWGDVTLVVRQHYVQSASLEADGTLVATLTPTECSAELAVPMTETVAPEKLPDATLFQKLVAIDLNETGIGWAVFPITAAGDARAIPVATGHEKVPSLRAMMRRLWKYEHAPNERTKFQATFNVNMSNVRESVLGHVSNAIDSVCAQFDAFPVLEMPGDGSRDRNVRSVFEQVMQRYTFSNISAHQSARRQYWAGADLWPHPTLLSLERKAGKPTGKSKPLNLFPGAAVGNFGNSQVCSCCLRNPLAMLAELKDSDTLPMTNGTVALSGGVVALYYGPRGRGPRQARPSRAASRYRDERSSILVADAKAKVRRDLREASGDSQRATVDLYRCVFTDCAALVDADVNAAINAGRKWLSGVAVVQQ